MSIKHKNKKATCGQFWALRLKVVEMNENIKEEYNRLRTLFENVDPSKSNLVDELLKKAAFLKCELDSLESTIKINGSIEKSNKGNVRLSIYYKTYLSSLNLYQSIIRTLNTIMGKNVIDGDDEFDEFLKKANA